MSNYSSLRVEQLRHICMQRGIDCVSMSKREMTEALRFDDDNRDGLGINNDAEGMHCVSSVIKMGVMS